MFFDRFGTSSEPTPTSSHTAKRRRQLAALGLAAAMALPAGALTLSRVYADGKPSNGALPPSADETVKAAQALMEQGKYEEAEETLRQINTFDLSDLDRRVVLSTLTEASKDAEQQRAARSELALGRQALSADRRVEARDHFNTVLGNRFADAATMKAAQDELARADGTGAAATASASNVQLADGPPTTLPTAPSPTDAAVPSVEATPNPTTAPTTEPAAAPAPIAPPAPAVVAPAVSGHDYYHLAQQQYRKGDWIAARQNFEAAKAANYKPGLFEGETPAQYLARMDAKESADKAATEANIERQQQLQSVPPAHIATVVEPPAPTPAEVPSPAPAVVLPPAPTTAPAVAETPGPTTAPATEPAAPPVAVVPPPPPAPSGHDLYHLAQQQYRKGDWIAARQNFEAAKAANYKPGLFEGETPAVYLARMDAKESADRAANEANIERLQRLQNAHAAQVAIVGETPAPAPVVVPPPAVAVAPAEAPTTAPAAPAPPTVAVTPAEPPATAPAEPAPPAVAVTPAPATAPAEAVAPPVVPAPATAPAEAIVPPAPPAVTEDQQALEDLKATQRAADLLHEQNVYQAQALTRQASDAQHLVPPDLDTAQKLYQQAVRLDPDNAQANAGLREVLIQLGRYPGPTNALGAVRERNEVEISEITYAVNKALADAHAATTAGDYGAAETALQRAQVASRQDPIIFTADALRNFDNEIAAARQANEAAQAQAAEQAKVAKDQQIQDRLKQAAIDAQNQKHATILALRASAMDLTNHKRFREALNVVDQILDLDPEDDYAVGVRPLLEDQYNFQQQRIFMEERDVQLAKEFTRAEEEKIPYDDILRYPTDWPGISQTRDQTVAAEHGEDKEDRAVQAQLDRALPELTFDGVGFSDVIDFLRDVSGANIFVNWKSLEGAGVDRNAPVTAKLRNVKFSKALNIILDSVGGGTAKLGYTIDEGVIEIGTADELGKNTLTRVYDIRDLIINIPDFNNAPDFSLQSTSNNTNQAGGTGGGGGGGGGGQSLFQGNGGSGTGQQEGQTRQELVDAIIKLITETVAPDSWRDSGGSVGALRELQGQLIVTQTPENQRALVGLLEQLRETHSIQVTVETRFLTVERNFLEDIGVDLSFIFNANQVNSSVFSSIPVQASNSTFTSAPVTGVPGSIGTAAQGLTTSLTYLDDLQVTLLLRATEASELNTEVTAPRVTLFNGQRAYVLVATQQAYVSNLTPAVGTGVSAFTPTISIVETGVLLDVQATVSADRKYVTLTLRPQQSNLLALQTFTFQGGSTPATGTGLGTVITSQSGTIQEPEVQLTEVRTTVSVPDGGTLLLGGETVAGEITKEAGTPVLSKIPFLRRLFTNRSEAKDELVLLILVKPTILIEREIENQQFPMLTSKLGS